MKICIYCLFFLYAFSFSSFLCFLFPPNFLLDGLRFIPFETSISNGGSKVVMTGLGASIGIGF